MMMPGSTEGSREDLAFLLDSRRSLYPEFSLSPSPVSGPRSPKGQWKLKPHPTSKKSLPDHWPCYCPILEVLSGWGEGGGKAVALLSRPQDGRGPQGYVDCMLLLSYLTAPHSLQKGGA